MVMARRRRPRARDRSAPLRPGAACTAGNGRPGRSAPGPGSISEESRTAAPGSRPPTCRCHRIRQGPGTGPAALSARRGRCPCSTSGPRRLGAAAARDPARPAARPVTRPGVATLPPGGWGWVPGQGGRGIPGTLHRAQGSFDDSAAGTRHPQVAQLPSGRATTHASVLPCPSQEWRVRGPRCPRAGPGAGTSAAQPAVLHAADGARAHRAGLAPCALGHSGRYRSPRALQASVAARPRPARPAHPRCPGFDNLRKEGPSFRCAAEADRRVRDLALTSLVKLPPVLPPAAKSSPPQS